MRSKVYVIGIIAVVILLALGFQVLPSPFQGGGAGLFSIIWYICVLAAGLGYWYKLDQAKARKDRQSQLEQVRRSRNSPEKMRQGTRVREH